MDGPIRQDKKKFNRDERAGVRIDLPVRVRYTLQGSDKEEDIEARIFDVSESGIGFKISRCELPPGTMIQARFQLPGLGSGISVTVRGIVRRSHLAAGDEYHTGVEFSEVSKDDRFAIRNFITSRQIGESL
jgi:c-di-GMP-binding flagellar brake protein YcgR